MIGVRGERTWRRAASAAAAIVALAVAAGGSSGCGQGSAPRPAPRPAVVWAVGDGATGEDEARAVVAMMTRGRVDRFLYLGDVYPDGTPEDFRRNYATVYGKLDARTAPTPGNHEWGNRRRGYLPYSRRVTGRPMPTYYAFRLAGWEIISLNSEQPHGSRSKQVKWLRDRLTGIGTCRIAFWHRPRYSEGVVHGDQKDIAPLWRALAGHAAIVVNGHEHDMQRFHPIDGITELVSGAGGAGRYRVARRNPGLAFANDTDYGALRLELLPGTARYAFVAADGRTLDAGQLDCRL